MNSVRNEGDMCVRYNRKLMVIEVETCSTMSGSNGSQDKENMSAKVNKYPSLRYDSGLRMKYFPFSASLLSMHKAGLIVAF